MFLYKPKLSLPLCLGNIFLCLCSFGLLDKEGFKNVIWNDNVHTCIWDSTQNMQIKHWNMNKTGIGKSKRRTSANRIPCGSRWMAIPWRWLSRKSSRRRNLIAAICLQSRQYIAISNSLDCRQRKVCYYNVMFIHSLFSCPVYIQIKFSGILVKIIITILT